MQIKVLVISDYRDIQSSRPEAEQFIGLKRQGVDINIMTFPDSPYIKEFEEAGIRVIPYHPKKKISRESIRKIRLELISGNYHILHLFNRRNITNGIIAARKLPVKIILYRGFTGGIHWYDPTAYLKFLNPRVDKVICLASSIEDLLHRQPFFRNQKAITINKGHRPEWYSNVAPIDLNELGIPEGSFVATCVANSRKMKGVPFLIRATHEFPPDINFYLLLVGNKMDTSEILSLIEKSPIKDKIHILGFRKDAMRIVKASNIFVLASLFGEATTKALLEAMSLGIAPLTTTIPGNRELVIDGVSGIAVPPADSSALSTQMLRLYNDPQLCKDMGAKAQKHVQEFFHTDKTVRETKALYEELTRQ